jgi:hypothetical protein
MGDTELPQAQGNVLEGDIDVDGAGGLDDMAAAQAVSVPVLSLVFLCRTPTALHRVLVGSWQAVVMTRSSSKMCKEVYVRFLYVFYCCIEALQ